MKSVRKKAMSTDQVVGYVLSGSGLGMMVLCMFKFDPEIVMVIAASTAISTGYAIRLVDQANKSKSSGCQKCGEAQ